MLRTNWVAFIILSLFWVIITRSFAYDNLLVGAAVSLLVIYFNRDIAVTNQEFPKLNWRRFKILVLHAWRMIGEVIKANIEVVKIVLSPSKKYDPGLVVFKPKIRHQWNQVIFANSISLTPGTFVLDIEDNIFTVHLLDIKNANSLVGWYIQHDLRLLEEDQ